MKRMLGLLAFLALVIPAHADTTWVAGAVSGEWTVEGSPYMATANLNVDNGEALVIRPGVVVSFVGHYEFRVDGGLSVIGAPDSLVTFTADLILNPEGWFGFDLSAQDEVRFHHCRMENVRHEGPGNGVINASSTNIVMNNVDIGDLDIGANAICLVQGSELNATQVRVHSFNDSYTGCGGVLRMTDSFAMFSQSRFSGGEALDGGGFCIYSSTLYFDECKFEDLSAHIWGGVIFADIACIVDFNRCVFEANRGNVGAIFFTGSPITMERCTIVSSEPYTSGDLFFHCAGNGEAELNSCIIAYNSAALNTVNGPVDANYSCQFDNGIILNGDNGFHDPPLFVDLENGNYRLNQDSPCIDAGDPNLPLDPDGTRADIGAFYYNQSTPAEAPTPTLPQSVRLLPAYPNPFNATVTFALELPQATRVSLRIFDLLGREVTTLVDETLSAGSHSLQWEPAVASGLYFAGLKSAAGTQYQKLVYLK